MPDFSHPYDELAAHYDQIFEDWEASITRRAAVLTSILNHECGNRRPIRVLDCACGIGTQSLGLAMNGFDVTGCDISCGAVEPETSTARESHPLWCCPKCGGPMAVIERLTAAQIQLRSPPLLVTTAA